MADKKRKFVVLKPVLPTMEIEITEQNLSAVLGFAVLQRAKNTALNAETHPYIPLEPHRDRVFFEGIAAVRTIGVERLQKMLELAQRVDVSVEERDDTR